MSGPDADKQYAQPNDVTAYPIDDAAQPSAIPQPPNVPQPPISAAGQPPIGGQPFAPPPFAVAGQPYAPGPQPAGQAYPPYTGYTPVEAEPRAVPENIRMAFVVMLVGAAVAFLAGAYALTDIDTVRANMLDSSGGAFRGSSLDVLVYATVGATVVGALVNVGLWIWMAFSCRAGKNWARITSTVFFGINVLSTLYAVVALVADLGVTAGAAAFNVAGFVIGLGAIVLLWHPGSAPFFAPARPQYPLAGPR
ncbi:hypothetical protein [Nocardia caishijiensis]|uniref:Integral membrane protein n=1 Tax=Nocardia caishijiensis TaxID=184756 RepID=A0ABQ6YKP6_9NOCA|nr:hypothetical protein [Nocardia caishijiensis]KAF0846357.1 hypothetical protein FNL39_105268 [Nocardia caishijiensis]